MGLNMAFSSLLGTIDTWFLSNIIVIRDESLSCVFERKKSKQIIECLASEYSDNGQ